MPNFRLSFCRSAAKKSKPRNLREDAILSEICQVASDARAFHAKWMSRRSALGVFDSVAFAQKNNRSFALEA